MREFGARVPKRRVIALESRASERGLVVLEDESPGDDKESNWLPAPAGPFWEGKNLGRAGIRRVEVCDKRRNGGQFDAVNLM